jgi:hypothetical protein
MKTFIFVRRLHIGKTFEGIPITTKNLYIQNFFDNKAFSYLCHSWNFKKMEFYLLLLFVQLNAYVDFVRKENMKSSEISI